MSAALKKMFSDNITWSGGIGTTYLQVRLNMKGLVDDHMTALGEHLEQLLASTTSRDEILATIEVAENSIGSAGLIALLDILENMKCSVQCKCLKFHKNRLTDEGGLRLARLIANQTTAVEEIHLSHNLMTQKSLVAICMTINKHGGYPYLGRSRLPTPCWLRMEHNYITKPVEAVEALKKLGDVNVCSAENRDECGPWRCLQQFKTDGAVPSVHLFTINMQSRACRPSEKDDAALRQEIARWGGRAVAAGPAARVPVVARQNSVTTAPVVRVSSNRGWGSAPCQSQPPEVEKVKDEEAAPSPPEADLPPEVTPEAQLTSEVSSKSVDGVSREVSDEPAGTGRASLLLDSKNKRRMAPEQFQGNDCSSNQFICELCGFVMVKPVITTTCCHLFCGDCFRGHVADHVSRQKENIGSQTVSLLPCPSVRCTTKLKKQDVLSLDKAQELKNGAATILQRMMNNLRVRCVHHVDLFSKPFGRDAEEISRTKHVTCSWIGDLTTYDSHLESCPVESLCCGTVEAAVKKSTAVGGTEAAALAPELGEEDAGRESAAPNPKPSEEVPKGGEVRVAKHDYNPAGNDQAQLRFKANDLIRVFEIMDSGWAAGIRLSKKTKEEVGAVGWFPAAYLHAAAEAA